MSLRCLVLGLLAAWTVGAAAQTPPPDATPVDETSGLRVLEVIEADDPFATPDLADALLRALGRPWAEIAPTLAPPDSSTITDGKGEVFWRVPGFPVDGFSAFVQQGRVESVRLDFAPDGPDLAGYASRLYDRLGSPRPDGFYATDQTGFPFSIAVDGIANRLDARAVPGQLVRDDVPLPIQFATVAHEPPPSNAASADATSSDARPPADSIHAYTDTPPQVVGGLAAIQKAAVYPTGATAEGTVFVELVAEIDGTGSAARVVRSPDASLDGAALDAVDRLRFTPGTVRGVPVRTRTTVPVRFTAPPRETVETPPVLIGGLEGLQRRVDYPASARRAGVEGRLFYTFVVGKDGSISGIDLNVEGSEIACPRPASEACSDGREALVRAGLRALLGSRFEPGTQAGRPVAVRYALPISFRLR